MELIVDITKKLSGFKLDVHFTSQNEIIGFLGASGSGKSMTLRCLAGIETPDHGRIVLNGRTLFDSKKKINLPVRDRKIGFLFQNYALFPHMTVEDNIRFGIAHLPKDQQNLKIKEQLNRIQLPGMEKRYPSELSGGQQQRVGIARAMVTEPELLLLDEPFSALDNHLRSRMELELKEVLADYSGTTVFVSHDINESFRISQEIMIYGQGRVVDGGDKDRLFKEPGHVEVAKITGCKNITPILPIPSEQRESGEKIECTDWNVKLMMDRSPRSLEQYVGIRAHHFRYMGNSLERPQASKDLPNVFKINILDVTVSPFRVMVYFNLDEHQDVLDESHVLQWDISRERWDTLRKKTEPIWVYMPLDSLFYLEN